MRALLCLLLFAPVLHALTPNLSHFDPACGIQIQEGSGQIDVKWDDETRKARSVRFDLREGKPLIADLGGVLGNLDPLASLTVGTRQAPAGRPPEMSRWNTLFDNPHERPHVAHLGSLMKKSVSARSEGRRARIIVGDIVAGPFRGEMCFTFFARSSLIQMEAVMSTAQDKAAYVFNLGLVGAGAGWRKLSWTDTEGRMQRLAVNERARSEPVAVRHRMIAACGKAGSVALFPPPHAFFYPLDLTNKLLLIPGEEINTHLGIPFPGRHPGHWMLLFPKPVYWTKVRAADQPFSERHPEFGTVYHASDRADMVEIIKREGALAWTAHPRIKASSWAPDSFQNEYYLRLPKMPRYSDGWLPVLDVLRKGAFFTTTGEVLLHSFTVGGKQSGELLKLPADGVIELKAEIEWTFPLQFAEIISGDGEQVFRERLSLAGTEAFGSRTIRQKMSLQGRTWARLEVWDTAINGAYSQPVWLE